MNYNKKSIFLQHRKTLLRSAYILNMDLLRCLIAHVYKLCHIVKRKPTAHFSTFERGKRRLTREQVIKLAKYDMVTDGELLTLCLSNKLLDTIENDPFAMQGLNKAKTILKTLI